LSAQTIGIRGCRSQPNSRKNSSGVGQERERHNRGVEYNCSSFKMRSILLAVLLVSFVEILFGESNILDINLL
jgi:hypothetical protein